MENELVEMFYDILSENVHTLNDKREANYYAEKCASICLEEMRKEAIAFAEWKSLKRWKPATKKDILIWYKEDVFGTLTTEELYTKFKEQTKTT